MKNFKKVTAIVLGATFIMSSSAMAFGKAVNNTTIPVVSSQDVQSTTTTNVIVKEIIRNDKNDKDFSGVKLLVTTTDENAMDILLKINDESIVKDPLTGKSTNLNATIKKGDTISVTYQNTMTRSLPPQTNAIEIIAAKSLPSNSNGNKNETTSDDLMPVVPQAPQTIQINGIVKEVNDGKSILIEDENSKTEICLNIDKETVIIDATGKIVNLEDLKENDKINVVHSAAMTRSLPPQTYAYSIVVNNNENVAVPQYIEVSKVELENGTTVLESADGNYIIRLTEDTEFIPFNTKNIVSASDIKEGTKLFAWYDIMTMSLPAQATATKVMLLPEDIKNEVEEEQNPVVMPFIQQVVEMRAVVKEIINEEYKSILVEDEFNKTEVSLNIDEDTIIIDTTGTAVNLEDLKADAKIKVVHSQAMTFSLPPQTYTYAIVVENEEEPMSPQYIQVGEVLENEDGTITVESVDKSFLITINKDAVITPFKTKNIVTVDDIKTGSILFAWYDIVTASIPAMANTDKVLLLPEREVEDILVNKSNEIDLNSIPEEIYSVQIITDDKNICINGETVNLGSKGFRMINSNGMIPLRVVAEKLGFEIQWDSKTNTATLDNGEIKTSVTVGKDSYYKASSKAIGLTAAFELGATPTFIEGNLYVPAELFNLLYSDYVVTVVDGVLNINTK